MARRWNLDGGKLNLDGATLTLDGGTRPPASPPTIKVLWATDCDLKNFECALKNKTAGLLNMFSRVVSGHNH